MRWTALAVAMGAVTAGTRAEARECELNTGEVAHGWVVALPGCEESFHFDLPVDFYTASFPGEVRTRFGAKVGYHWAADADRRVYVGPVLAATGGGLSLDGDHRFDNARLAPAVSLRGFAYDFLALEGSLGPVLDRTRGPAGRWHLRPGAQLALGPRILGVVHLRAGYEWVLPAGPLPGEGRYLLGASVTLGGALIGGAVSGLFMLCQYGGC